jgi:hypothetical protein
VNEDGSVRLVRGWVQLYTRGLPDGVRDGRRDELEADLWDEAAEAADLGNERLIGRARLSRLLRGMPADIAWRIEQVSREDPQGRQDMVTTRRDLVWGVIGAGLGAVFIWAGVTTAAQPNWQLGEQFGLWIAAAGAIAVLTSVLTLVRPVAGGRSTVIAAVAVTIAVFLAMPWAWFVALPFTATLGFVGARQLRPRSAAMA